MNSKKLLYVSVVALWVGVSQSAQGGQANAQVQPTIQVIKTQNGERCPLWHPNQAPARISILWDWGELHCLLRLFGYDRHQEIVILDTNNPPLGERPRLFGSFGWKRFFAGLGVGFIGTLLTSGAVAYALARGEVTRARELGDTIINNLDMRACAEGTLDIVHKHADDVALCIKQVLPDATGKYTIEQYVPQYGKPPINLSSDGMRQIGRHITTQMQHCIKNKQKIDVDTIKATLLPAAAIGGASSMFAAMVQMLSGNKSFALGCILSSCATAGALCAVSKMR